MSPFAPRHNLPAPPPQYGPKPPTPAQQARFQQGDAVTDMWPATTQFPAQRPTYTVPGKDAPTTPPAEQ